MRSRGRTSNSSRTSARSAFDTLVYAGVLRLTVARDIERAKSSGHDPLSNLVRSGLAVYDEEYGIAVTPAGGGGRAKTRGILSAEPNLSIGIASVGFSAWRIAGSWAFHESELRKPGSGAIFRAPSLRRPTTSLNACCAVPRGALPDRLQSGRR